MTSPTGSDWIREGVPVAIYIHGHGRDAVRLATVERLTSTQIILPENRRFRRSDLREVGGQRGTWDPQAAELMQPDDPRVINLRAGQRIRSLVAAVERATAGRIESVESAQTALAAIEAELNRTRVALDGLARAQRVAEGS